MRNAKRSSLVSISVFPLRLIIWCAVFLVVTGVSLTGAAYAAETPYGLAWTRQLGTSSDDRSLSVAIDGSGNAYISGYTYGSLGGTNAGGFDAFLAKYDSAGSLLWTEQLGTSSDERCFSVAIDGSGNAYISGYINSPAAYLAKYDSSGSLLWTRQLGTSSYDYSHSVAIDGSGNAYISGHTSGDLGGPTAGGYDAFLAKYDSSGSLLWTEQLGTSGSEESWSVAIDGSGNAYISGRTGSDAFLAKYDSSGSLLWTEQLGTSSVDYSRSVAIDGSGNAYISGRTDGSLGGTNAGDSDAFLAKYDSSGALLWTQQLGTSSSDYSFSVAIDGSGNAYISGRTYGSLGGTHAGDCDAFLAKYDDSGSLLWTEQLGTSAYDESYSVAIDGSGNAYISGWTYGSLGGTHAGGCDAFLAKYDSSGSLLLTEQLGQSVPTIVIQWRLTVRGT
ncbi:MAG: SBBP repeat-containing protein, partial [Planctomycetota bacterium]